MADTFGTIVKLTTFGESHSDMIGAVLQGVQSSFPISEEAIRQDLSRRRPASVGSTARVEKDEFSIASGVFEGKTTGAPIAILIPNTEHSSKDYDNLKDVYRPGHADYTWSVRYRNRDYRGGGRSSGRETVARVAAGSICRQILRSRGITISSRILSIGGKTEDFEKTIEEYKSQGESVGARIQCIVHGLPAGVGEPIFDKLDAVISHAVMSIGAVKGIEFGSGFGCEMLKGSINNKAQNAGGIVGGLSDGNDIVFNVAVKPTPSVSAVQTVLKADGTETELSISGRHDTCIGLRIGVVIEAMTAIAVLDMLYQMEAR